jgi:hypothetical protein
LPARSIDVRLPRGESPRTHLFPPALVPVLRDHFERQLGYLAGASDEVIGHLLTTVFFAGLETYEGERNPVRVVVVGDAAPDVVMPEGQEPGASPFYRWKILRFAEPRPFVVRELVKLCVATVDERFYAAVRVRPEGKLDLYGLAREGVNASGDPFVKVIVPRPGGLSVRNGRDHLLEYEHGTLLTGGEDLVFAGGSARRALEVAASGAGFDDEAIPEYVDAVRALVREMASHGHGGILVVNPEEHPKVAQSSPYRMVGDSALAPLLRLSKLLGRKETAAGRHDLGGPRIGDVPPGGGESLAFRHLLRNSFSTEVERIIEEFGALTGIDGATVLNRHLALIAFGVILPVSQVPRVVEAADPEGAAARPVDLASRGTRHRAAASYAAEHPGSVVFVASEDGQITCMLRSPAKPEVLLWRLGAADVNVA